MIIRQHYLVRTLAQNDKNAALGLDRLQSDAWTFLCLYLLHTIHNRNHWNKYAYTDHANRNKKHKSTFGRKTVFSNQFGVACLGKNVFKRLSLCRRCMSEGLLICGSLALLKSKWRRVCEHATAQTAHVFVCLCIAWFDIVHHQQNDTMESCPDISDHRLSFGFQTEMLIVVLVWSWQKPSLLYILDAVNQQHWYVCSEVYPLPLLFCIYL